MASEHTPSRAPAQDTAASDARSATATWTLTWAFAPDSPHRTTIGELLAPALTEADTPRALGGTQETPARARLEAHRVVLPAGSDTERLAQLLRAQAPALRLDWCLAPVANARKRLLVCDMDSTIIGCECIDEVARLAGVAEAVSAVTEQAMAGALDFADSLRARVSLLKGAPTSILEQAYQEAVRLNPGAHALVATMQAHGAFCALVSGGFTMFTARVAALAGFDAHQANVLLEEDGALTGLVREPVLDRDAKEAALVDFALSHGITPSDAVAIGDGANDAAMVRAAGLGIAYCAKPALARVANAAIHSGDLRAALFFQGYEAGDIIEPE